MNNEEKKLQQEANDMKKKAAVAAMQRIIDEKKEKLILGVGTGSTVNLLIDLLPQISDRIKACVASSKDTEKRLLANHLEVIDLNDTDVIDLYIDGADEINKYCEMIKGGGGALTREKIIASMAQEFWCIIDETKFVQRLGKFPLPVEVIPMARSYIARDMVAQNSDPVYRYGFLTDNGNQILDIHHLDICIPADTENHLNMLPGVVTCGIFSGNTAADLALIGTSNGEIKILTRSH